MLLTTKQIKFLKKEAHHLKPIFQIGKSGVSQELVHQIGEALEKRELIKVHLLQNTIEDKNDAAELFSENLDAIVVQIIGSTVVLFKQAKKEKNQKISQRVLQVKTEK